MSKLSIEQKTIRKLLIDMNSNFLIPDYQCPYAWTRDECDTLWDDIFVFCFPDFDYRFEDKTKIYLYISGEYKTKIAELQLLASQPGPHFAEEDIEQRTLTIMSGFMDYLAKSKLLSDD